MAEQHHGCLRFLMRRMDYQLENMARLAEPFFIEKMELILPALPSIYLLPVKAFCKMQLAIKFSGSGILTRLPVGWLVRRYCLLPTNTICVRLYEDKLTTLTDLFQLVGKMLDTGIVIVIVIIVVIIVIVIVVIVIVIVVLLESIEWCVRRSGGQLMLF